MTFGTGPQALIAKLQDGWQAQRAGRDDVPDVVRDANGDPSSDPDDADPGADERVLILKNLDEVAVNTQVVDPIHVYHPEADPLTITDNGFKEQRVNEMVQIDIELADRTDHATDARSSAKDRMVSDRGSLASLREPPYPGILGETIYVLETLRRGFDEYERVSYDPLTLDLLSSNAVARVSVDLEQIARNTVV